MPGKLDGLRVAMLATDGVEQIELERPREALRAEGARVDLVAPKEGRIRGWNHSDWGKTFAVDRMLGDAHPEEYDALVLPGGVMNPDHLRVNRAAVQFVRRMFELSKPIAAICHGAWTLIDADAVHGRRMTSYPSLEADLRNAGAEWVDEEVVVDQGLITSRKPGDLPAFNRRMIEEFAEGRHERRQAA